MTGMPDSPAAGGAGFRGSWSGPSLSIIAIIVVAVAVLYFGQDFLIPFALAVLLSFALGPAATRLRRWGLGRIPSVIIVVTLAVLGIGAVGLLVGSQVVQLADNLPTYQQNIRGKIRSLQSTAPGGGVFDRAASTIRELGEEISEAEDDPPPLSAAGTAEPDEPVVVRIEEPPPSPLRVIEELAGPLLAPVATAGLVVVLVVFMLLERENLRDRFIKLVGGGDLHLTTEALGEAANRVSRYLLMQFIVNVTYGLPIGIGLYLIGVPNALLWGVLATVLRFIPFLGPFIAALFPVALSIAVDPGWTMFVLTIALFLSVELISNNVVEPWLYGASVGVSSLAIILAAFFWATLWGPVGLFLSAPLTVCLAVMGRYIPQLRFIDIMLGAEPAMKPEERLYQRMLAGDPDEGEEIAREFLSERPLTAFYDEVAIPALRLAELDRQRKALTEEQCAVVIESLRAVVVELADHEDTGDTGDAAATGGRVLCIGGRTGLDAVAAEILALLLRQRGIDARALAPDALEPGGTAGLNLDDVGLVCLSYLGKAAIVHARQVCRRLRREAPHLEILVGLWNAQLAGGEDPGRAATGMSADAVAPTLEDAVSHIGRIASDEAAEPMTAPPAPGDEAGRLAELKRLGLLDTGADEALERITSRLAEAFGAPIASVSLVDEHRQVWKSPTGLTGDLLGAGHAPREMSVCGHVVATGRPVIVEDVLRDRRFANNPFLRQHGIRFYAGAPLRTSSGHVIGSLCVIDFRPRTVSERDRALLQIIADEVVREIESRPAPAGG